MNPSKMITILVIIIMSVVACEDVKDVSIKAKEMAIEASQKAAKLAIKTKETTGQTVVSVKLAAEQKVDEANQVITAAVNNAVTQVVNEIKVWIFQALAPLFPWMFIIIFLLFFLALKAVIPLSTMNVMQIILSLISYIVTFWLFAQLGLTSFALKGTLYFVIPIASVVVAMHLIQNKILSNSSGINAKIKSIVPKHVRA